MKTKRLGLICLIAVMVALCVIFASCSMTPPVNTGDNTNTDINQNPDQNIDPNMEHTITLIQGDGFADVVLKVKAGESIETLPNPKNVQGYNITWENVDLTDIREDKVVYAVKAPIEYKINYDLNGGINNPSNPKFYTVESLNKVLYAPTKLNNATFVGWYTTASFQEETKVTSISECYYEDITLYACWLEYQIEEAEGFEIITTGTTPKIYKAIPNSIENIDLNQAIKVSKDCTWKMYRDFQGYDELKLKAMTLGVGENKAYIIVYHPDGEHWTRYELVLYRLDILQYAFYNGTDLLNQGTIEENSNIIAPTNNPTKLGYSFKGWQVNGERVFFPYKATKEVLSPGCIVFQPFYEIDTYSIQYVLNGGENNALNPTEYTILTAGTFLAPTKEHYDFVGWYEREDLSGSPIVQISIGEYGNRVLYAKWKPTKYNINYVLNGGTNNALNPDTYTIEEKVVLEAPSRAGYTFAGWFVDTSFNNETTGIEKGNGGDITFYAKWIPNQNTLIFNANGGTGSMPNMTIATDESVSLTRNTYKKSGYTFKGWSTTALGNVVYSDASSYIMGTNSSYTLYAVWEANINTLVFDANGGTGSMADMFIATESTKNLTESAYSKVGYAFKGWSTTKDGAVEYLNGASYKMGVESKYTLYAVWEIVTYNITYNLNGGINNSSNPSKYTVEDTFSLETPSRDGYTFAGWYTDSKFSNKIEAVSKGTTGNKTLYAKWSLIKYTITYELNGGTNNASNLATYTVDDLPLNFKNPTHSREFLGWYTDANLTVKLENAGLLGDITLYAKWGSIVYTEYSTYVAVTGYDGTDTTVVIPSSFNGKPVTSIGEDAFYYCSRLTSVTIPDSVTSIGYRAFYSCDSLTSVNYLGTIENWCNISFSSSSANPLCYGKKLYLNGELVTELTIPSTVTEIKDYAFYYCNSLTSVTIPDSVTSIGNDAFYNCTSLISVNYLGTIENWCNISFSNSYANPLYYGEKLYLNGELVTELTIPSTVTEIKDYAFYDYDSLTSVTIPDSVTSIGDNAFYYCDSLTSVTIGNSVTSIGNSAFYNCTSLISVTIPDGVTSIGIYAFDDCYSLTIYCEVESKPSGWSSSWNNSDSQVVWDCKNNTVASDGYIYTVIDGIRYGIKYNTATVVRQPSSIVEANIPSSITYNGVVYPVTSIGVCAFEECGLKSVTIGNSVTSIGDYAFRYCGLTSVTIPDNVISIGEEAFYYCGSLKSVTIPDSVISIGDDAFRYCGSLKIYCEATSKPSGWISSWNYSNRPVVWGYVVYNYHVSIDGIKYGIRNNAATVIEQPKDIVEANIPSSITYNGVLCPVTGIGDYAFKDCSSLTSVSIGNSVTSIGNYAFRYCGSLKSVTIPNSVTSIGSYAFYDCDSLTSVTIPDGVTSIGDYAFAYCSSLKIYCEATNKPSGWDSNWNYSYRPVVWGHTHSYTDGKCICGMKEN